MTPQAIAAVLARAVAGRPADGELAGLPDPWRTIAGRIGECPPPQRADILRNHLAASADGAEIRTALDALGSIAVAPSGTAPDDDDTRPLDVRPWPDPPDPAVYHGPAGAIVREIENETEADPLGIVAQLLVALGNLIGRGPHVQVESTRHGLNEFALLVGDSATGRKGTGKDRAFRYLEDIDPEWLRLRVTSGLSTGEGVISAIRDPTFKKEPIKENKRITGYEEVMVDEGVADKRLLVVESEFGRTLAVQGREGNTLTAVLRQAWDGQDLAVMTKSGQRASTPHVSIIGHVTAAELLSLLGKVDLANGYANRFLWFAVRRVRLLPFGGRHCELSALTDALADAVGFAKSMGRIDMTPGARALWESSYARLTTPPPGVLGKILSRAAPHVRRLAALYAVLDRQPDVADDHLAAALALWDASERCAAYIFGDSLGDNVADKILEALRAAPTGLTRTEISVNVFNRNADANQIVPALRLLIQHGLAVEIKEPTAGRPRCRYTAAGTKETKETKEAPRGPDLSSSTSFSSSGPHENGKGAKHAHRP